MKDYLFYSIVEHLGDPCIYRQINDKSRDCVGDSYIPKFGWSNAFPMHRNPDLYYSGSYDLIEQFEDEERAKQFIRDIYHEEPVNFDAPSRDFEKYYKWDEEKKAWIPIEPEETSEEKVADIKKKLGFVED